MLPRRFIPGLILITLLSILLQSRQDRVTAVLAFQSPLPSREQQVVERLNQIRWQNGQLPPLKNNIQLQQAAVNHSRHMAERNFFDHCDFDTQLQFWQRIEQAGYNQWDDAGENIAAGFDSAHEVMQAWMKSPGHRENVLSLNYREVGVGFMKTAVDEANIRESSDRDCQPNSTSNGPYYNYWTQNFGRRDDVFPLVINREAIQTNQQMVSLYLYGLGLAQSMRLRNEAGSWTPWQPFVTNYTWSLSPGNGLKTVSVEISQGPNGSGAIRQANDTILLNSPDFPPAQPTQVGTLYLPVVSR